MSLLFQPEHIAAIRTGEKTTTRRDWADNYNRPTSGTVQMAVTELFTSDDECDCYIAIEDIYRQPLSAMDESDAQAEGGYMLTEFRNMWQKINGADAWDAEKTVDVVEFAYVGRTRSSNS